MEEDQLKMLSDEGRQARWPWGKFFQSFWVERESVCVKSQEKNMKRQHVQRARGLVFCALGEFPPWNAPKPANFFSDRDQGL